MAFAGPLATFALAALWGFLARHFGPVAWVNTTLLQALLLSLNAIELLQAVLNLVPLGHSTAPTPAGRSAGASRARARGLPERTRNPSVDSAKVGDSLGS
jgi:hypothetical protein